MLASFTTHRRRSVAETAPCSFFFSRPSLFVISSLLSWFVPLIFVRIRVRVSFFIFHRAEPFAPTRPASDGGPLGRRGSSWRRRRGWREGGRGRGRGWQAGGRRTTPRRSDGRTGWTATWVEFCGGFHAEAAKNTFTPSDYETEGRTKFPSGSNLIDLRRV